jgi:hypothetical protein
MSKRPPKKEAPDTLERWQQITLLQTVTFDEARGERSMTITIEEPVCVAPTGDRCGEGAVWSQAEAALYWTDIARPGKKATE